MRKRRLIILCLTLLVSLTPVLASAISLNEAAQQAARRNNAKVLSARTVKQGNKRIHQIKLLKKNGVVKTVRVPENSKKK